MIIRKNPPSFVLIEKATGLVVYTRRATGVGSEAISGCVDQGRKLAAKTGKTYTVFLDVRGLKCGMKVSVPMVYALGITEEIRPSAATNPGRVRKNIFAFNNPPSGPADRDAARELELYIDNDSQLYHSQFIPIVKNLMLKRRKGIYRNDLAKKLFMYLMDAGARKYVAEFGTQGQKIDSMFNRNTRLLAANHFVFAFENEAHLGNYDRLIGPVSNPGRNTTRRVRAFSCHCGRRVELEGRDVQCEKCGQWYNAYGQRLKDPSKWTENPTRGVRKNIFAFNNPGRYVVYDFKRGCVVSRAMTTRQASDLRDSMNRRGERVRGDLRYGLMTPKNARGEKVDLGGDVRPNIFAFNNPRKLNTLEQAAAAVGLYITTWAPGDGKTRYRFHRKPADYHDGTGIYTAVGRADALNFIKAYGIGKERKNPQTNPPSKSVRSFRVPRGLEAQVASMLRNAFIWAQARDGEVLTVAQPMIVKTAIAYVHKHGSAKNPLTSAERRSINRFEAEARSHNKFATMVGDRGGAIFTSGQANAINRIKHMVPCKANPCSNPKHGHVLPNPLLQTVLLANPGSVKTFNETQDVGKAKYVVNYHDGVKVHRDGSPFFDIAIFSSRAKKDQFVRKLESLGFTRGTLRNPPISEQWNRMTGRQRIAVLDVAGYDEDSYYMTRRIWANLQPSVQHDIERAWFDSSAPRRSGTTRRRAAAVGANPLTRAESARVLKRAKNNLRFAQSFQAGHTRSEKSGQAFARGMVVKQYGPRVARRAAGKIITRAQKVVGTTMSNPGIKFPKPGTKMTVAQAMDLARRIGDRELIRQCQEAMKLQKKANRGTKSVIWKTLPIGSPTKIDMVTAFMHYGDSPEDMYKAPKGSSKGQHMYRHKWGDGTGKSKPVPVLAAPGGKAIIKLMGPGQKVGDWMRG